MNWTGWTDDVVLMLQTMELQLGEEFTLARVYKFEDVLHRLHPKNNHIQAKIRQQLQVLQAYGYIEFLGNNGTYRLIRALPE